MDFKDTPMAIGAAEVYYWSMDPADLERVPPMVTHAGAQHGKSKSARARATHTERERERLRHII